MSTLLSYRTERTKLNIFAAASFCVVLSTLQLHFTKPRECQILAINATVCIKFICNSHTKNLQIAKYAQYTIWHSTDVLRKNLGQMYWHLESRPSSVKTEKVMFSYT